MIFNSLTFVVFLAIVLPLYFRLKHRGQNWMLIVASYVFYGWWDYRFLGLLLFTTFFDYFCAIWIETESNAGRRRWLLASSMTVNLTVLGIFKYFNFFSQSLQEAFSTLGIHLSFPILHVVLPVGISFYTFLSMSYTIDVYRKELRATHDATDFMLYVAFFPHLVAGPIVRASFLLPQCQRPRKVIPTEVANGLWLILMGYVKKVVIADRLAQVVNWGFAKDGPPFADANSWLVIYAFAFQIYGDFSGYSDIARGLSKLMGFELVENFRAPYLVTSASAFWRNWHISLSTWLRDYLYIPLGGNRHGRLATYRNLMLTMLLGGLWHGAGAAYVLWGLYHGLLLAIQRAWADFVVEPLAPLRPGSHQPGPRNVRWPKAAVRSQSETHAAMTHPAESPTAVETLTAVAVEAPAALPGASSTPERIPLYKRLSTLLLIVVFFHITCIGWLLFRAGSLPAQVSQVKFVLAYLGSMLALPHHVSPLIQSVLFLGSIAMFFQWRYDSMNSFSRWRRHWQAIGVILALLLIAALGVFEGSQFIYFQF